MTCFTFFPCFLLSAESGIRSAFPYLRPVWSQPAAPRPWRLFAGPWSDVCVPTWRGSGWPSLCKSAVRHKHNHGVQLRANKNKIQSKTGADLVGSPVCFKLHKHLKTTKAINGWSKFTSNKITAWLNGSGVALFLLLGLRSGIYPRGIQIGAIVLSRGIHLGAHGGCFQWAMLTSLSGDRKDPSLPGRVQGEERGRASIWIIWIASLIISFKLFLFLLSLLSRKVSLFFWGGGKQGHRKVDTVPKRKYGNIIDRSWHAAMLGLSVNCTVSVQQVQLQRSPKGFETCASK